MFTQSQLKTSSDELDCRRNPVEHRLDDRVVDPADSHADRVEDRLYHAGPQPVEESAYRLDSRIPSRKRRAGEPVHNCSDGVLDPFENGADDVADPAHSRIDAVLEPAHVVVGPDETGHQRGDNANRPTHGPKRDNPSRGHLDGLHGGLGSHRDPATDNRSLRDKHCRHGLYRVPLIHKPDRRSDGTGTYGSRGHGNPAGHHDNDRP